MAITPFSGITPSVPLINTDLGGRSRVSQITTLFDGKVLNGENTLLWDTKGTGTATWVNSGVNLSVTAGQYLVRQAKYFCPYLSGKAQVIEGTFDNFVGQAGVVKRAGYFSSSAVAPYDTAYDGVWIESTGTSYKLCIANSGTMKCDIDWTQWDNYAAIQSYDWSVFTVTMIDFLWLGGTDLRLFLQMPNGGFILAHTFQYAGTPGALGPFMRSPNQPMRYEIRSTTGAGSFNTICSQIASEGSISEVGFSRSIFSPVGGVAANTVGTIYALKSVRALVAQRDLRIGVRSISGSIMSATSDSGTLMLLLNPTLSAAMTYVSNGLFDEGTASAGQTVTALGTVVDSIQLVSSAESATLPQNLLSYLPVGIDNAFGQLVLAYMPTTANQTVGGSLSIAA